MFVLLVGDVLEQKWANRRQFYNLHSSTTKYLS